MQNIKLKFILCMVFLVSNALLSNDLLCALFSDASYKYTYIFNIKYDCLIMDE